MLVFCPKCGEKNNLQNAGNLIGKRIKFPCSAPKCNYIIEMEIPGMEDDTLTEIIPKGIQSSKGRLSLIGNKYHKNESYILHEGVNIVGRKSPDNIADWQLLTTDSLISRKHFSILGIVDKDKSKMKYYIKDEHSRNKIRLNGQTISSETSVQLFHGDEMIVGESKIIFEYT